MKKSGIRIITLILALLLVLGMFSGVFAMLAWAAPSTDATLKTLTVSAGTLSPAFAPDKINYTVSVPYSVSFINVTPTVNDANASVELDGTGVTSGSPKTIDLYVGINTVEIVVTAEDGTTKETYTITVTRAAALDGSDPLYKIITADTTVSKTLTIDKVTSGITISFNFLPDDYIGVSTGKYSFEDLSMPANSSFGWTTKTELEIKDRGDYYQATLKNVTYTGGTSRNLELYVYGEYWFSVPISSKYFNEAASGADDIPASDIIVQSVTVKNASGQKLERIDKDTPPFTVEIVFYDAGLINESKAQIKEAKIYAYITSAAGFKVLSGTGGTVEVLTSAAPYPRFRATFTNLQSDGTGNSLAFRVQYELPDYDKSIKGEKTAELSQVETKPENEDQASSLRPNLIIQEYAYGEEAIVAGSEFKLDMKISNTSKTASVENVVMKITEGNGFVIAAASNTVYFTSIPAGGDVTYSVALRAAAAGNNTAANPDGKTDYSVQVEFSYQYLDNDKYVPPVSSTPVKIAIPVIQLDRFGINEITDYSQYMNVGEEGYISVPIINKGNSTTFNIAGSVLSADETSYVAPVVNFGNLDAGKSGTVDLSITINVPGEFNGQAVIHYEDENRNQKQLTAPFSIMVNEPFIPPPEMPPETPAEVNPAGPPILSILFCTVGGLLIAAPIALYSIKRVKARGNEDIDEDF